ncbi:MAG: tRNA (cytidine(34)-2'-O)-methyltransferase [Myxococcota bacterium]
MSRDDLHVVLVEPEIPWNTGNIGRSCLAAGAQLHLVGPLGFTLDDKRARRAGLDYWPAVKPSRWVDFDELHRRLPDTLFVALTAEAEQPVWSLDLRRPVALVLGSEGRGLPEKLRRRLLRASIPMEPSVVRSLNVSTAAGIALWEARRQRAGGLL